MSHTWNTPFIDKGLAVACLGRARGHAYYITAGGGGGGGMTSPACTV